LVVFRRLLQGKASLQAALVLARQVALEAVQLMEGPAPGASSPPSSPTLSRSQVPAHDASPANSRQNSASTPTKSLGVLTEQVASFGTYQNKGFARSGNSRSNSRNNSSDGRNSGDGSAAASSSSGSGLRFPTMPWATLRRDKSTKRSDTAVAATSIVSSSPIAKAELEVAREFVYDASSKERSGVAVSNDAFIGEGAELERPRSVGVDRYSAGGTRVNSTGMQESEFDDNELFLERDHVSPQDLQGGDFPPTGKSPDISIKGASGKALPPGATLITSSGGHTGGLLSTLTSSSMTWSFPVVRAIHGVAGTSKGTAPGDNPVPGGANAGASSGGGSNSSATSSKSAARAHTKQMKSLEKRGQWVQQQIIDIDRYQSTLFFCCDTSPCRLSHTKCLPRCTVAASDFLCCGCNELTSAVMFTACVAAGRWRSRSGTWSSRGGGSSRRASATRRPRCGRTRSATSCTSWSGTLIGKLPSHAADVFSWSLLCQICATQ
jgi:hypothetical protein